MPLGAVLSHANLIATAAGTCLILTMWKVRASSSPCGRCVPHPHHVEGACLILTVGCVQVAAARVVPCIAPLPLLPLPVWSVLTPCCIRLATGAFATCRSPPAAYPSPPRACVSHQVGDRHICYLPLAHIYERINLVMVNEGGRIQGAPSVSFYQHPALSDRELHLILQVSSSPPPSGPSPPPRAGSPPFMRPVHAHRLLHRVLQRQCTGGR